MIKRNFSSFLLVITFMFASCAAGGDKEQNAIIVTTPTSLYIVIDKIIEKATTILLA